MAVSPQPRFGPVLCGTVVCASVNAVVRAYRDHLDMTVVEDCTLAAEIAEAWGQPGLAGRRIVTLGADAADPATHWLRLLEIPHAPPPAPLGRLGWLAMEVLVADVRALGRTLSASPFQIRGEPRPLAVSDDIWAMQAVGPAGEVLYLTEGRAQGPPFRVPAPARRTPGRPVIPGLAGAGPGPGVGARVPPCRFRARARRTAERLFIPVLAAAARDPTLADYERLAGSAGLRFETRVSALNAALAVDPERARPVATVQLDGASLIEIDEVPELAPDDDPHTLPSGLAMVSFVADQARPPDDGGAWRDIRPRAGWPASGIAIARGPAGEWIEWLKPAAPPTPFHVSRGST